MYLFDYTVTNFHLNVKRNSKKKRKKKPLLWDFTGILVQSNFNFIKTILGFLVIVNVISSICIKLFYLFRVSQGILEGEAGQENSGFK